MTEVKNGDYNCGFCKYVNVVDNKQPCSKCICPKLLAAMKNLTI